MTVTLIVYKVAYSPLHCHQFNHLQLPWFPIVSHNSLLLLGNPYRIESVSLRKKHIAENSNICNNPVIIPTKSTKRNWKGILKYLDYFAQQKPLSQSKKALGKWQDDKKDAWQINSVYTSCNKIVVYTVLEEQWNSLSKGLDYENVRIHRNDKTDQRKKMKNFFWKTRNFIGLLCWKISGSIEVTARGILES